MEMLSSANHKHHEHHHQPLRQQASRVFKKRSQIFKNLFSVVVSSVLIYHLTGEQALFYGRNRFFGQFDMFTIKVHYFLACTCNFDSTFGLAFLLVA
jgi:hypothetical protein